MSPRLEDFYVVPPPEIELLGGWYDGRRMRVPDDRWWWIMPAPQPEPSIAMMTENPLALRPLQQPLVYRWTGSVRDDGTRVFRYEG